MAYIGSYGNISQLSNSFQVRQSLVRIFPPKACSAPSRLVVCQFCGLLAVVWLLVLKPQEASGASGPEFECGVHVYIGSCDHGFFSFEEGSLIGCYGTLFAAEDWAWLPL